MNNTHYLSFQSHNNHIQFHLNDQKKAEINDITKKQNKSSLTYMDQEKQIYQYNISLKSTSLDTSSHYYQKPLFIVETRKQLNIQTHINLNERKLRERYLNKDLLKYVCPKLIQFIKNSLQKKKQDQTLHQIQMIKHKKWLKIIKKFEESIRSPNIKNTIEFFGFKSYTESDTSIIVQLSNLFDNIRIISKSYLSQYSFMKNNVKGTMMFMKKLNLVKKCNKIEKFPLNPEKIFSFSDNQ